MIRFIVDSTVAISEEYAKAHRIPVVNLKLILDEVVTDEGFEPAWGEFYARYEKSKNFPTTSQPNPEDFEAAVRSILAEDPAAEIIIVTIASFLSGSANSARLAAEMFPDHKVAVVDSQNGSLCETILLEELVDFAAAGGSFEDTIALSNQLIEKLGIQFVPPTMKYLNKGGRIGTLSTLFASIIMVKPIFDFRKNQVTTPKKALGISKAIVDMIRRLPEKIRRLCVVYIHDNTYIPALVEKLKEMRGIEAVEVRAVSPVFGIHIGIGTIGVACLEA